MRLALFCFAVAYVALTARASSLPITADSLAVSPNTNSLMDNADERVENLAQENNPRVRTVDTSAPQNDFEPTWVDWGGSSASPAMRFAAVNANAEQNVEEPPEIFTPPMRNLSADPSLGCLEAPFAVCVGMPDFLGPTTIAADSLPKGIAGWWDFDDNAGFDKSGRMNYITPAPKAGPGFMGFGSSGYFNGSSLSYIEHQPPYSSNELTIMFWIFLIDEPAQGFRTVLYKGSKTRFSPSIQLWPESRRLKIRVSTSRSQATSIDTVAAIPVRRWTHVAYVAELEVVRVFINGILDTKVILPNYPVPNKDPIFLANDPWHLGARMYIDDLRLYSRRIADAEIEAIGDLALPGLGAGLVRLGCSNCKINPAFLSCPNFYHVCSRDELDSGALQVARVMGWVSMANMPYLWHRDDTDLDGKYGTALCCRDN